MAASTLLFLLSSLAIQGALSSCDPCEEIYFSRRLYFILIWLQLRLLSFHHVGSSRTPSVNISLKGSAELHFTTFLPYTCPRQLCLEILRDDGKTELYTVLNGTYDLYAREEYTDRGLEVYGDCHYHYEGSCNIHATLRPTDLR